MSVSVMVVENPLLDLRMNWTKDDLILEVDVKNQGVWIRDDVSHELGDLVAMCNHEDMYLDHLGEFHGNIISDSLLQFSQRSLLARYIYLTYMNREKNDHFFQRWMNLILEFTLGSYDAHFYFH